MTIRDNLFLRRTIAPSSLPRWSYYRGIFGMDEDAPTDLIMVMESEGIGGTWHCWVNEREVKPEQFEFRRLYDIGNRCLDLSGYLKPGSINEITFAVQITGPSDGLLHPVRIFGDFELQGHPRLRMRKRKNETLLGSLTTQGFPHFGGIAEYRTTIDGTHKSMVAASRLILDCGRVEESCRVFANGEEAGARLWAPFTFDLSRWIGVEKIELVIEVAGNAGNMIDGTSKPVGLSGPVCLICYHRSV